MCVPLDFWRKLRQSKMHCAQNQAIGIAAPRSEPLFSRFATACVNQLTLPCVALILKSAVTKVTGGARRRLLAGVNNASEDARQLVAW